MLTVFGNQGNSCSDGSADVSQAQRLAVERDAAAIGLVSTEDRRCDLAAPGTD